MITQARLRKLFALVDGKFVRIKRTSNHVHIGDIAGTKHPDGCIILNIDYKFYKAHRLVWLYIHGEWPPSLIDHINGIRDDNRIENLRLATRAQNNQNQRNALVSNKSCSLLGVTWCKQIKRWKSRIQVNGHQRHLGTYNTAEEAHAAYVIAKRELHPFGML